LALKQTTVRHFNVWGWRIKSPWISTAIFRLLLFSWISRKPSTLHGTLAYYINCQN
jgi:hypothetical protein